MTCATATPPTADEPILRVGAGAARHPGLLIGHWRAQYQARRRVADAPGVEFDILGKLRSHAAGE